MAIQVNIEKNFKGFSLRTAFESTTSSTGILGASGSGKSMTLRCIAGIETPDRGKIVINGRTVFDSEKKINLKPQERRIGYLFQNYALFRYMTVYDNVAFGLKVQKVDKKKIHARVMELVKLVGLEGLGKRYPSQLSGGQQQRVLLARALCAAQKILLLDEPVSGLDPRVTAEMYQLIRNLNKKDGITIIMISHDIAAAVKYATHILHIGEHCFFGTKKQYLESSLGKAFTGQEGEDE